MEDELATDVGTRDLKGISEALEGCLGCGVLRPLESWLLTAATNVWVAAALFSKRQLVLWAKVALLVQDPVVCGHRCVMGLSEGCDACSKGQSCRHP